MNEKSLPNPSATQSWGKDLAKKLQPGDIVCLDGPLGAGKTTLAQAIAKGLSIDEPVTSPTYALIHEYVGPIPLFHMDLYRISGEDEFELIGGPEYFEKKGICLIEWSERIKNLLPKQRWTIDISIEDRGRKVRWSQPTR